MIGKLQKLIVAVAGHLQTHHQFVPHLHSLLRRRWQQHRPLCSHALHKQLLFDRQFVPANRRHVGDVVEILPVDATPGGAGIRFGESDTCHGGHDLAPHEAGLDKPGARLGAAGALFARLNRFSADVDGDQGPRTKQIVATAKQSPHGIGSGPVARPPAGALLRQEPELQLLNRPSVAGDLIKGLDHHRLRFDRGAGPVPPGRMGIAPPHPLRVLLLRSGRITAPYGPLSQAIDDR